MRWLLFRESDGGAPAGDGGGAPAGDGQGAEGAPAPQPSPPSGGGEPSSGAPSGWKGPSEEEWNTAIAALHHVYSNLPQQEQEELPDFNEMSPDQLVEFAVEQKLQGLAPVLQHATKQAGEARLNSIFDEEEKTLGKFDRKLAEKIANAVFYEVGDPLQAAKQGAAEAKRIREEYGQEAVNEYKKSLQRPNFDDPELGGAGNRLAPDAKTYDEVISKWSGEEEV